MVLGGVEIRDDAAAERFGEVVKGEIGRSPEVGERITLDACVPKSYLGWYEKNKGRPCPRVELTGENGALMQVVMMTIGEMTRTHAPAMLAALFPDATPDESAALLRRIGNTIGSDTVQEWLHPDK